jgi:hypothetical protein
MKEVGGEEVQFLLIVYLGYWWLRTGTGGGFL